MDNDCIFCKIISKDTASTIIYEDDRILCFKDVAPQAPIHVLLIPKKHIPNLLEVKDEDKKIINHLMAMIPVIAKKVGLDENGFRFVSNCKEMAGQSVFHLHFHMLGGRAFSWPPG